MQSRTEFYKIIMKKKQKNVAPLALGPYSQSFIANGFIFCSGQIGVDPKTMLLADGIEAQTHQVMKNLQAVLQEAGGDLDSVVKTTIYLKNVDDFAQVNEIYAHYFGDRKPARATVGVADLPRGKFSKHPLIEIEAVAEV